MQLVEELGEGRFARQQCVISALQRHESGIGYQGCEKTALLERDHRVVSSVHHQGRCTDLAAQIGDVDGTEHLAQLIGGIRRR